MKLIRGILVAGTLLLVVGFLLLLFSNPYFLILLFTGITLVGIAFLSRIAYNYRMNKKK